MSVDATHKDGVPWYKAPAPPKNHEHTAQTSGFVSQGGEYFERCACGAGRYGVLDPWMLLDAPRVAEQHDETEQPVLRIGATTKRSRLRRLLGGKR